MSDEKPPIDKPPVDDATGGSEKSDAEPPSSVDATAPESTQPKQAAESAVEDKPSPAKPAEQKPPAAKSADEKPPAEEKPPWLADPATPEWQDADDDPLAQALVAAHDEAVLSALNFAGDLVLEIASDRIAEVCDGLKGRGYTMLIDLCGVDYPDRDERFEVIYQLYSFDDNRRIQLKARVAEDGEIPTVCDVWRAANWMEREAWDMYGIRFSGHPDLTRILTWEGFNGHPLRKDFPVEGIDTGAAAYPEYYLEEQGPVAGTGTGWKPPQPPEPEADADSSVESAEASE